MAATNWGKIRLLEGRLAWWRGKASYRRRELLKYKATGDRSHYWHEVHLRKHEAAAAKRDEAQWPPIRAAIGKWSSLLNEAEREIHKLETAIRELKPKAEIWPAGGWVRPGTPFRMERQDQGQDMEIPLFHSVVAPGDGVCTLWSSDRPFPFGFGDPYMIVRIDTGGRFAGNEWYLGHANEPLVRPGQHFVTGQPLARLDHSLEEGWGWIEIGKWDGGPHDMSEGERQHWRFAPLWR